MVSKNHKAQVRLALQNDKIGSYVKSFSSLYSNKNSKSTPQVLRRRFIVNNFALGFVITTLLSIIFVSSFLSVLSFLFFLFEIFYLAVLAYFGKLREERKKKVRFISPLRKASESTLIRGSHLEQNSKTSTVEIKSNFS